MQQSDNIAFADTPVNCSVLDGDDFAQFVYDAYNVNSARGIYLSAGNYNASVIS